MTRTGAVLPAGILAVLLGGCAAPVPMLPTARDFGSPHRSHLGVGLTEWPTARRQPEPSAQDPSDAPFWNLPQPGVQADAWLRVDTALRLGVLATSSLGGGMALVGIAVDAGQGMVFDLMGGGQAYSRPSTSPEAWRDVVGDVGPAVAVELNRAIGPDEAWGAGLLHGYAPWGSYVEGCTGQLGCMTPDLHGVLSASVFVPYLRWQHGAFDLKLGLAPGTRQPLLLAAGARF